MAIADAYGESPIPDPSRFRRHAEAAISTILAALQEPTEAMQKSGKEEAISSEHVYGSCIYSADQIFSAMLNASPLGEKSE
jgi:hypothetical protein